MSADRVAALAEVLATERDKFPRIPTDIDSGELAERLLASPAMRDLLAEERARALREAAKEARSRGDIGRPDQIEVWDWLKFRADREQP